jgi:hypothetical protein
MWGAYDGFVDDATALAVAHVSTKEESGRGRAAVTPLDS